MRKQNSAFSKTTFLTINLFLSAVCFAQATSWLDPTFYPGRVVTGFSGSFDHALDSVIQPDGKIIAAGYTDFHGDVNFAVTRYISDGTLDKTFGPGNGRVQTQIGSSSDIGRTVALQPDGRILVGGSSYNGATFDFAIVRYLANGTPDNSFSGDGKVTTSFGGSSYIISMAVQPDAKIVVAGAYSTGSGYDIALARYNPDGTLDATFDGDGKLITSITGTGNDIAQALTLQPDGKIVAAGYFYNAPDNFVIVRYNTNGSLDTTFDGDGKVFTALGGDACRVNSVAIQADGRIVAGGYGLGPVDTDFTLVRYNSDGSLDGTFDGDGTVITPVTGHNEIRSLDLQPDGKIITAGYSVVPAGKSGPSQTKFALARYNSDGSLDAAFDTDGIATMAIGTTNDVAQSVNVVPNGKIVAVGHTDNAGPDFAVARFNPDGSPDSTFGKRVITALEALDDNARSTVIQPDGKIVVAGTSHTGSDRDFAVARYRPDGMLDTTFGTQGRVVTPVGTSWDSGAAVTLGPHGTIVVAGQSMIGQVNHFAVVRYNPDGTLDTSFGGTGKIITPVANSSVATSIARQANGKIVVGGVACGISECDFAAVRYNTNGSLDTTFDGDGKVVTSIGENDQANAIAIQPDGKILLAGGDIHVDTGSSFKLLRYNTNGSLDLSFSNDGKVTIPNGSASVVNSIDLQSDGKIVAAGATRDAAGDFDFALARLNTDGSLDTSFDGDGRVQTALLPGSLELAFAVAVSPDGQIVAAGEHSSGGVNTKDTLFVRYLPDGSRDTSFGSIGVLRIPVGGADETIFDVAIQPDGQIVGVGEVNNGSPRNFLVMRINGSMP